MASIKVKFRHPSSDNHEGIIYYQIHHERKQRQVKSEYRIFPSEWNDRDSKVITDPKGERRSIIRSVSENIQRDLERLTRIIHRLEGEGIPYTADYVADEYIRYSKEYTLFNFMDNIISCLKDNGRIRTSETYTATLNSFRKFRQGRDIMLDCINVQIMNSYEAWNREKGNLPNTISFYNRILRAVYNRAVEEGATVNRFPFRKVYTGIDKTVKRALPLRTIKKIKSLNLSHLPSLDYARDMFILSFMLRGMSFIDMAYLKKTDLVDGYITYRRRKTGKQLIIKWTEEMQAILDKYPVNRTDYLLPIIKNHGINERCAYRNVGYKINHNLKVIAKKINISFPLTLYVARHSWASVARGKGIPISIISEGMGHDSESTTQIYLASLDTSIIDRANSLILKSL